MALPEAVVDLVSGLQQCQDLDSGRLALDGWRGALTCDYGVTEVGAMGILMVSLCLHGWKNCFSNDLSCPASIGFRRMEFAVSPYRSRVR